MSFLLILFVISSFLGGDNKYAQHNQFSNGTPREVIIYYESFDVARFTSMGPVQFKHLLAHMQKREITNESGKRQIATLANLGISNGNPRHVSMRPSSLIMEDGTIENQLDYPRFDIYILVRIVYDEKVETIALTEFKSNGCIYLEKECITEDVGLYDFVCSHVISN